MLFTIRKPKSIKTSSLKYHSFNRVSQVFLVCNLGKYTDNCRQWNNKRRGTHIHRYWFTDNTGLSACLCVCINSTKEAGIVHHSVKSSTKSNAVYTFAFKPTCIWCFIIIFSLIKTLDFFLFSYIIWRVVVCIPKYFEDEDWSLS